jgi:hypothetical protein
MDAELVASQTVGEIRAVLVFVELEEAVAWALAVEVAQGVLVEDRHWVGVEVWVEVMEAGMVGVRSGVVVLLEVAVDEGVGVEVAERVLLALVVEEVVAVMAATVADLGGEREGAEVEEAEMEAVEVAQDVPVEDRLSVGVEVGEGEGVEERHRVGVMVCEEVTVGVLDEDVVNSPTVGENRAVLVFDELKETVVWALEVEEAQGVLEAD